jgi:hypothetical protein
MKKVTDADARFTVPIARITRRGLVAPERPEAPPPLTILPPPARTTSHPPVEFQTRKATDSGRYSSVATPPRQRMGTEPLTRESVLHLLDAVLGVALSIGIDRDTVRLVLARRGLL